MKTGAVLSWRLSEEDGMNLAGEDFFELIFFF